MLMLAQRADMQPIDAHNRALKAPATPEADRTARLQQQFGAEGLLTLAFLARTRGPMATIEEDGIAAIAERLRAEPWAAEVSGPSDPLPDLRLLSLRLSDPDQLDAALLLARGLCPKTLRLLPTGLPALEAAIAQGVAGDRQRLLPAIAGSLLVLLLLAYRSVALAVGALLPAGLGILMLGAFRQATGRSLDPIAVLLEPVVLTVGVAAAVHQLAAFRQRRSEGLDAEDAARAARGDVLRPATLATVTTLLGFWSLSMHPIPAVADFGLYAAVGAGLVHALCLLLLPTWLADFPGPDRRELPPLRWPGLYGAWLLRRRRAALLVCAAAALWALQALLSLRVDNDPLAVLPQSHPARADFEELSAHVGGVESFSLLGEPGPQKLRPERLLPFVAAIASTPPAAGPAGPPRMTFAGNVQIPIRLSPSGSDERTDLFSHAEQRAAALDLRGVAPAGLAVQIARDSERLVFGQLRGTALAAAALFVVLLLWLKSWRLALLGMAPNLLPCVLLYGGLSLLGEPLTVANAMIGSVMLGLVIDNTIHLLHHYRSASGPEPKRIHEALSHTASPMTTSTVVLAVGFGAGLLGDMRSTHQFSALAAATVGLALAADGILLPALLAVFSPRSRTQA